MPRSRGSPYQTRLQKLLVARRQASPMTQSELAVRLGRPQSFVSKYEIGERRLDVVEFLEVSEALGVDACELLKELRSEQGLDPQHLDAVAHGLERKVQDAPGASWRDPDLVSIQEAAAIYSRSPRTIRHWVAIRKLKVVRLGRTPFIRLSDLRTIVEDVAGTTDLGAA